MGPESTQPIDLESVELSQSEEELKAAAQTDKVVRGVNGGLSPKARKTASARGAHHHRPGRAGGCIHAAWPSQSL